MADGTVCWRDDDGFVPTTHVTLGKTYRSASAATNKEIKIETTNNQTQTQTTTTDEANKTTQKKKSKVTKEEYGHTDTEV